LKKIKFGRSASEEIQTYTQHIFNIALLCPSFYWGVALRGSSKDSHDEPRDTWDKRALASAKGGAIARARSSAFLPKRLKVIPAHRPSEA